MCCVVIFVLCSATPPLKQYYAKILVTKNVYAYQVGKYEYMYFLSTVRFLVTGILFVHRYLSFKYNP